MLTKQEVDKMATEMYGTKWKASVASNLGLSVARIYQLMNNDVFPKVHSEKLLGIYQQWRKSGATPLAGKVAIYDESVDNKLTDEQISQRISERFTIMGKMVDGMIVGAIRSMIIYGAPGIGKTFDIERSLEKAKQEERIDYSIIKGTVSAPGLYIALYKMSNGGICVLDDADSIFGDEQAFNILKSALDTTDKRVVAWRKKSSWVYDVAKAENADDPDIIMTDDQVPNEFLFTGGMIFITNIDFNERIAGETKFSPHFNALMSRSLYLDLTLKSKRARMIRIKDVFMNQMAKQENLSAMQAYEILNFVNENADNFIELSLRTIKHVCHLYKMGGDDWKQIVKLTKMKPVGL